MRRSVWVGYDPREQDAFAVALASIQAHASEPVDVFGVNLPTLVQRGLYQRPISRRGTALWDPISNAPMSTEFAISRFFVPLLATEYSSERSDLAIFMDCDVLLRADIGELFALADPSKAVQCVQHKQEEGATTKMDGQTQTFYARKNWSSVVLWNLRHPANRALTISKLNTWTGRALHGFNWLEDPFIGSLPQHWNHLVGVHPAMPDAKLVHYTLGVPSMPGYQTCEHANEWWATLNSLTRDEGVRPS